MIQNITEQASRYDRLEKMPVRELLENINREDHTVPQAVKPCIPDIEKLVEGIVPRMKEGGRLFYIGAEGTSGRRNTECIKSYRLPSGAPMTW